MRYHRRLPIPIRIQQDNLKVSETRRTLGRPVVPLENVNVASFVRPSPGFSLRSSNLVGLLFPACMTSRIVRFFSADDPPRGASMKRIRSSVKPTRDAASFVTEYVSGWHTISFGFVISRWYCSSSAL